MLTFLIRRCALGVITVCCAVVIVFILVHLTPGSPGSVVLGAGASAEQIDALNESLGWNQPFVVQLGGYFAGLLQGDLGNSLINGRSVGSDLISRLQVTGAIAIIATLFGAMLGAALGIVAAVRGGLLDRIINVGNGIAMSLPPFWVAVVVVFIFAVQLGWLPATGYVPPATSLLDWARSITLPVFALSIPVVAVVARTTKVSLAQSLGHPSTQMLRSVGTSPSRLLLVHSLRSASIPVISVVGVQFVTVFTGSLIVENFFGLPGVGQAISTAVTLHDIPMIEGAVIVTAVIVVAMVLLVDVAVGLIDPRVRRK